MTDQELCIKLNSIWKRRIIDLALVETGTMLRSISFSVSDGKLEMSAVDYFKYLDIPYDISNFCIRSKEFNDLIGKYYADKLATDLVKGL